MLNISFQKVSVKKILPGGCMSCKLGCGQKGYSSDQKRTMQLIFYLLNCVLLTSTPTPTLNFPLIIMKKIVIMFVQCDKNYAVLMCACPVAPYKSSCQVKLSFIVIPLHVWAYSGTRCRASQDHGAT